MTKQEFLDRLRRSLAGLPLEDAEERLAFYDEMIDDRTEEGLSEEEAVSSFGTPEEIADQILSEIPLSRLVRERVKPKRALRAWEIVLLVLGFPVWFPILISLCIIALSVYVVLWSVIVSLYAVDLALAVSAVGGIALAVRALLQGQPTQAAAFVGASLLCAGLAILLFLGCVKATKGAVILTKRIGRWIKSLFVRKGENS
ncbi:MAG: DUF1700 domain-containing protein [Oscillospiraceae bacterium]|nr:DUF1700 domain-containing protein [Oscillospiraceae bacterium]